MVDGDRWLMVIVIDDGRGVQSDQGGNQCGRSSPNFAAGFLEQLIRVDDGKLYKHVRQYRDAGREWYRCVYG